jgi:hypothetical protein
MLNFSITKSARTHWLTGSIACLYITLYSVSSWALEISTPVGIQEIGRTLSLKSTLSGIPEGAESQLRSTCLKGSIRSLEKTARNAFDSGSSELHVNFQSTIRQGGLIEFSSIYPVNDSLVQLELVSECPLLVFSNRWTLIMNESKEQRTAPVASKSQGRESMRFDFDNSSLLKLSRKAPEPIIDPMAQSARSKDQPKFEKLVESVDQSPKTLTKLTVEPNPNAALKVASSNENLYNTGLIESHRDASVGIASSDPTEVMSSEPLHTTNFTTMSIWLLLGSLPFFGWFGFVLVRRQSAKRVSSLSSSQRRQPVVESPMEFNSDSESAFEAPKTFEPSSGFSSDQRKPDKDRFLESLMTVDDKGFDDTHMLGSNSQIMNLEPHEASVRTSLEITLDLINRTENQIWNLPDAYSSLVTHRNKRLSLNTTLDAIILRSHIGLVELAFQDAKQGILTNSDSALQLFDLIIGERNQEIDDSSTLCVPDVVKSHVRSKMCEVSGAEKRQILRDNLLNLNTQVVSPALCFGSDSWREFLSEEGILD